MADPTKGFIVAGPGTARPVFQILEEMGKVVERFDGAKSEDALVWGTYLHGVFDASPIRRDFLNALRRRRGWKTLDRPKASPVAETLDSLATWIRKHVDLVALDRTLNGL